MDKRKKLVYPKAKHFNNMIKEEYTITGRNIKSKAFIEIMRIPFHIKHCFLDMLKNNVIKLEGKKMEG